MAFIPHYRLVIGGRWYEDDEWSVSLRFATLPTSGASVVVAENCIDAMVVPTLEYFESGAFSAAAELDYIKFNAIDTDGRYVGDSTIQRDLTTEAATASGATTFPQVALVVSTRTEADRGRGSRGRWFTPGAPIATGNGHLTNVQCISAAAWATNWVDALNVITSTEQATLRAAVVSNLGAPGPARHITRIEVGDVVDTQRRRRSELPETYYGEDLA